MKTDLYTKAVLTVIAICLTIIVFNQLEIIPKAIASNPEILNQKYGMVPVNADGSIDVNIKSSGTMDVNIDNISTWKRLKVEVEEVDFNAFSNCTVPVKMK